MNTVYISELDVINGNCGEANRGGGYANGRSSPDAQTFRTKFRDPIG